MPLSDIDKRLQQEVDEIKEDILTWVSIKQVIEKMEKLEKELKSMKEKENEKCCGLCRALNCFTFSLF